MNIDFCNRTPLYLERFTFFAAKQIGLDKLRGDIHLSYYPTLENDSYGLCWGDGKEVEIHIASKMSDRKVSKIDKMKTVVHELVHARQFLRRELSLGGGDDECNWHGRLFRYDPKNESEAPWEVEAVSVEQPIYEAWLTHVWQQRMGIV